MAVVFRSGMKKIAVGEIDLDASTMKILLMKKGANASLQGDTHDFFNDIPTAKRCGANDKIIQLSKVVDTGTTGKVFFQNSATSVTFNTVSTDSIEGYVVFKSSDASNTSPLLCYNTLTSIQDSDGGSFKVIFNANGILQFSG